jgi:hypothetical protein
MITAKPLEFAVPIVGQPLKVHSVVPQVFATCQCAAKTPIILFGLGATALCDGCQRAYTLQTISHDPATGQIGAGIGVGKVQ